MVLIRSLNCLKNIKNLYSTRKHTRDKEDVIVQPNNLNGVSISSDIPNVASTVHKKEESEGEMMVLCLFFKRRWETRVYKKYGVGMNGSNRATQREKSGEDDTSGEKGTCRDERATCLLAIKWTFAIFNHVSFCYLFLCHSKDFITLFATSDGFIIKLWKFFS